MNSFDHTAGWRGVTTALRAAVLFAASTPLAKAISPRVDPVLMADQHGQHPFVLATLMFLLAAALVLVAGLTLLQSQTAAQSTATAAPKPDNNQRPP